MQCPKCQGSMQPVEVQGITVDRCDQCQGLWFDALEDRDIRGKAAALEVDRGASKTGAKQNKQGKIKCPHDGTPMVRMVDRQQRHIWYESCSICHGKFFDAGEFRDLKSNTLGDVLKRVFKGERKLT